MNPAAKMPMCRVCMVGGRQLVPFARFDEDRKSYRLADAISAVGGVQAENDDGLPQYCCTRCLRGVETAYRIHQMCQETDRKLREMFRVEPEASSLLEVKQEVPLEDEVEIKKEMEEDFESEELIFKEEIEESQIQEDDYVSSIKQEIEQLQMLVYAAEDSDEEVTTENTDKPRLQETNDVAEYLSHNKELVMVPQLEHEEQQSNDDDDEEGQSGADATEKSRICCGCSQYFESPMKLIAHGKKVHYPQRTNPNKLRPYQCNICYQNLANKNDLYSHLRRFREDRRKYACSKCEKGFYSYRSMKCHQKLHGPDVGKCHMCPFVSIIPCQLRVHIEKHSMPDGIFKCFVCGQSFSSPALLRTHSALHPSKIRLRCPHCPRVFNVKTWLKRHMAKHVKPETAEEPLEHQEKS